jgi:hypothetical protein
MPWLFVAAGTTIFIAAAHSYLGEKLFLQPASTPMPMPPIA